MVYRFVFTGENLFSLQGFLELTEDSFIEIPSMEIHFLYAVVICYGHALRSKNVMCYVP